MVKKCIISAFAYEFHLNLEEGQSMTDMRDSVNCVEEFDTQTVKWQYKYVRVREEHNNLIWLLFVLHFGIQIAITLKEHHFNPI